MIIGFIRTGKAKEYGDYAFSIYFKRSKDNKSTNNNVKQKRDPQSKPFHNTNTFSI